MSGIRNSRVLDPDQSSVFNDAAAIRKWADRQEIPLRAVIERCLFGYGDYKLALPVNPSGQTVTADIVPGHKWCFRSKQTTMGPEPADVMVIGKCLNRDDVRARRVYAGEMGTLFAEALRRAGFDDQEIDDLFIATILATQPLDFTKSTLPKFWIDQQQILVMQQLLLVRPKYCLLQGAEAVKAMLGNKFTLSNTEGRVIEKKYEFVGLDGKPTSHTVKFVTSTSPAAILHDHSSSQYGNTYAEKRLHKQLVFLRNTMKGIKSRSADELPFKVIDDTESLESELKRMRQESADKIVAWDAEWQGDHPQSEGSYLRCIQFAYREDAANVIALTHPGGEPRFKRRGPGGEWTTQGAQAECARLCKEYMKGMRVCGHYFVADLEWLVPFGLDLREEYDAASRPSEVEHKGGLATELMAHAYDESAVFSLDDQLRTHTDVPAYSHELEEVKKKAKEDANSKHKLAQVPYKEARSKLNKARKALTKASVRFSKKPLADRQAKLARYRQVLVEATSHFASLVQAKRKADERLSRRLDELEGGYGWIPDNVLYKYGAWDVAAELTLGRYYLKRLRCDRYGKDIRKPYWMSHRAAKAVLEINRTGLLVDRKRLDKMSVTFSECKDRLLNDIRLKLNWPNLNLRSRFEFAEVLFGDEYNGYMSTYGRKKRYRPKGAFTLRAEPLRATGKYPIEWNEVREMGKHKQMSPATTKQTLGEMYYAATQLRVRRRSRDPYCGNPWEIVKEDHSELIGMLRDFRYIDQSLKSLLRPPNVDAMGGYDVDEDGEVEYDAGIANLICKDGRVRGRVRQTVETGRWAMRKPNLQAQPKSREADLKRIVGGNSNISVRSIFKPYDASHPLSGGEDWFIIEADYSGAELMMAAIMSQDENMIEHCQRNLLDEDDPEFFDIHSSLTVKAFKFDCEPTKAGLAGIGKSHLRTVGKSLIFGSMYGRSPKAIAIAVRQEGVMVTVEECQALQDAFFEMYPDLDRFFDQCRARVASPGWLCNMFGRYRRFPSTSDEMKRRAYEREAMNAPIQGGVADAMSYACRNIVDLRDRSGMRFELVLQIHDAVFLHVPASELKRVVDKNGGVLQKCMIDAVPLVPTDLDGRKIAEAGPYRFGTSIDIYSHWGEIPGADRFLRNDLCPSCVGWTQRTPGVWQHKKFDKFYLQAEQRYAAAT